MAYAGMANRKVKAYHGRFIRIDFELDRSGIRKVAAGKDMRDATTAVVKGRALPYAVSISPYDEKSKGPHYRDSFRITQGYVTIAQLRRVATRLHNISPHSTAVEWHNGSRVLGRTLAFLNHDSVLAEIVRAAERAGKRAARRALFESGDHPRDARGRFTPKPLFKARGRRLGGGAGGGTAR